MSMFDVHDKDSAPEKSKEWMEKVEQRLGMVPNVVGVLAESPAALKGYVSLQGILGETDFSPAEQQVLMLTVSRENDCEYCVAAHTGGAKRAKLDDDSIQALRDGKDLPDEKLNALSTFCATVYRKKGWVEEADVKKFLDAGYTKENVLDVLVAIATKLISNWANHMAETPLDEAFKSLKWEKAA